ncbi:MAG TPA: MFS transporter, partial [Pseudolysinimonas sp.]|nr:MFS transporter [Pseudolysinimonas sp.]
MIIVLPIFLQYGLELETSVIGLMLLPGGLLMGLLGPLVGRLYDKFGPKPLVIPGSIAVSTAFWVLAFGLGVDTPIWFVIVAYIGLSLGLAFLFTPLFSSGLGALPPHLYSHGSALVATIQQVAGAAGTAMFVAFLAIGMAGAGETDVTTATPEQITAGVHLAFLAGAVTTLALVAVSFFVRKPLVPEVSEESLHAGH